MAEKKPLLDLSTDKYINNIRIDGKLYGLLKAENLNVVERHKLTLLSNQLSKTKDIKTQADENKHDKILRDVLAIVMPEAGAVLGKLSVMQKLDATNAYMAAAGLIKKKVKPLEKGPRARKKTRK